MAVPTPPNPSNPIPNQPFYYPETNVLQGTLGPFIIGSSLNVSVNGVIEAVGGGPAVTYLTGGPGIYVSANTGNVNLYNTGVLSVTAGTGIGISGSIGNITITNTMPAFSLGGTVTQINTGDGLSGGPITTSGTIALSNTGVGAATYTNPTITVDEKGRITAASPGTSLTSISGAAPIVVTGSTNAIISVNQGSPTVPGVVCVSGSVTSTSATVAASSQAVKTAYDVAQAALPCSVLIAQGDLITANTVGAPLRIAAGAEGTYLKVCASCVGTGGLTWGTVSSGGGGTVTSITAGTGLTGGTISASGTIALDTTCVIAPSALSSKGALLTATATATPIALGSGSNGQVLTVNTLCSANLEWVTPSSDIPCSAFNVKGDLLVGTGPATYSALPVGTNGQVLAACSSCTSGVAWIANSSNAMPTTGGTFTGDVTFYGGIPAGEALTLDNLLPGDGYDGGNYPGTLLFGGTGSGAIAEVNTTLGGEVDSITLTAGGSGYTVGDVLTPDLFTPGTDASIQVATIGAGVPSAGIIDCAGSGGTVGQILQSNGANAICWVSITVPTAATPTTLGTVYGFTEGVGFNTGFGEGAFLSYETATGERNTFIGAYGGASLLTTASYNSGVGQGIFGSLTSGCNNTAMGDPETSGFLTTGCGNSAFGSSALLKNVNGSFNVGVGYEAGSCLTTGSCNVAIGPNSQFASNTGSCQLAIGFSATDNWLTGDSTKAIKPGAGIIDCAASTGTAGQVLMSNGSNAICWGAAGGGGGSPATPTVAGIVLGCTTANNSALGCNALVAVTTGNNNVAIGLNALNDLTTGCLNVAMGVNAASLLTTGRCNTAVGHQALASTVSSRNNVALGYQALCTVQSANSNVAIGMCSLFSSTFGYANVAVGCCAGFALDAGAENTLIGDGAGSLITIGNSNVVIGSRVEVAVGTGSCQLAIGFNVSRWLTGDCNFAIKPGNGVIDCANSCGTVGQYLWTTGSNAIVWASSSPSDIRDKEVIGPVPTALPIVQQIEPITYRWKERDSDVAQEEVIYGFSAQQLQEVDSILVDDSDQDHLRIHDRKIVPLLVKAIQELSAKVEELEKKLSN